MRIVLALFLFGHGIAHLVGFVTAWQLRVLPEMPFHTTLFNGRLDVGVNGIRVVGVAWLLATVALSAVAFLLAIGNPIWARVIGPVLAASILLCLLEWPLARIGLLANAVAITALVIGFRFGWFPAQAG